MSSLAFTAAVLTATDLRDTEQTHDQIARTFYRIGEGLTDLAHIHEHVKDPDTCYRAAKLLAVVERQVMDLREEFLKTQGALERQGR